jgi:phosphoserine phosphatase RsbU/P
VTKTIPSYLRLHSGSKKTSGAAASAALDPIARFWHAYTNATGWRVDSSRGRQFSSGSASLVDGTSVKNVKRVVTLRPALENALLGDETSLADMPAVSEELAQQLAIAASELANEYRLSIETLRHQESELAAADLPAETTDNGSRIGDRLQKILTQVIAATRSDSAAIYMLDEQTTSLKMRASVGLPSSRLLAPARPLRGSRGDLESLVCDVVLIDDLEGTLSATWNSPEAHPSAIVVKIEEDDLPVGTLWIWSDARRSFDDCDGASAQLAATAIAGELAKFKMSRQRHRWSVTSNSIQTAAQWQMRQLPPAMELAPGYFVDGWTESSRPWACSWHSWEVLPDGTIAIALAEAEETQLDGAMIAATARAAFAAHSNYRHSVTDMLSRVSDSLWQTNTGDQIVSMLYAHLDPDTGEGQIASAGLIQAIIAGKRGFRPLCSGSQSDPLASRVDCRLASSSFRLQAGEVLVAVNRSVIHPEMGLGQDVFASVVRESICQVGSPVLSSIRRALADKPTAWERAGLMLHRTR